MKNLLLITAVLLIFSCSKDSEEQVDLMLPEGLTTPNLPPEIENAPPNQDLTIEDVKGSWSMVKFVTEWGDSGIIVCDGVSSQLTIADNILFELFLNSCTADSIAFNYSGKNDQGTYSLELLTPYVPTFENDVRNYELLIIDKDYIHLILEEGLPSREPFVYNYIFNK